MAHETNANQLVHRARSALKGEKTVSVALAPIPGWTDITALKEVDQGGSTLVRLLTKSGVIFVAAESIIGVQVNDLAASPPAPLSTNRKRTRN